jgi:hypothetical protein
MNARRIARKAPLRRGTPGPSHRLLPCFEWVVTSCLPENAYKTRPKCTQKRECEFSTRSGKGTYNFTPVRCTHFPLFPETHHTKSLHLRHLHRNPLEPSRSISGKNRKKPEISGIRFSILGTPFGRANSGKPSSCPFAFSFVLPFLQLYKIGGKSALPPIPYRFDYAVPGT